MDTPMRTTLISVLLLVTGCGSMAPPECQMLPSAQGGYVLRFTRTGSAAPGCDTATPAETSDIWIFDTLANSEVRVHAALSMAYTGNEPDPLPAGLIGAGRFTQRDADGEGFCNIDSFTAMTDGIGLTYEVRNLQALGSAATQNAEWKAEVTMTVGTCTAEYTVQALSPAVPCESDADCDPFKQPFSSGIFSVFDQGCKTDPWATAVTTFFDSSGVCFLNQPFPSLK
jgi:hypothetical protein